MDWENYNGLASFNILKHISNYNTITINEDLDFSDIIGSIIDN